MMKILALKKLLLICFFILLATNLFSKDDFEVLKLDNPSPGYIKLDRVAYLLDNYGKPVFADKMNFGTNSFKLLKNGLWAQIGVNNYYLFDINLELIDSIANPTEYILDAHDIISLSNGHYLILCQEIVIMDLSKVVEGGNSKANVISNVLVEVDTYGKIYWQWRAIEHTKITDIVDDLPLTQYSIDFTHINSMDEDVNGNILISIRHFDEVALINRSTGDFIWRLGGSKSKNNQFTFVSDTINGFFGFSHQHSASILPNGNILLYDYGNLKPVKYSRAVEYSLDFSTKIATKVWEYRYSLDIYNGNMGSAFRLENGNTLINYSNGRVVEVKPDQTIAFEINSLLNANFCYIAQKTTLNSVYSKNVVSKSGNYKFYNTPNNTGIRLDLKDVSGISQTYIQRHDYSPPTGEYADSLFSEILPYRWVITSENKISITGTINIDVGTIANLNDPENVIIFQRNKEASGIFQELPTSFNSTSGEISATFSGLGEFTIGSTRLISPNLISPSKNAKIDIFGSMIWEKSKGASKYRLQISDDKDFFKIIKDTLIENSTVYHFYDLLEESSYNWKVKAFNVTDSSEWSEISNFTTENPLNNVKLKLPSNEQLIAGVNCNFEWMKRTDADFYMLEISNTKTFFEMIHQEKNIKNDFFQYSKLIPNSTYYWRVCYFKNDVKSEWSEVWTFNTSSQSILDSPILSSPENDIFSAGIDGQLIWKSTQGAKAYQISVSRIDDFSTLALSKTDLDRTSFNYSNLEYDTKYYWRVAAYNDSERSNWSAYRAFYTELEAPKIIIPFNNSDKIPTNGFLRWDIKKDFYTYNLQISKNIDFSDLIIDSLEILDKKFKYYLEPNTTYYCRVKTYNNYNKSKWSDAVKFKTENSTSVISSKNSDNLEIFPNPVSDILQIQAKKIDSFNDAKIYDFMGNLVITFKINSENSQIDVSKLISGVYFIIFNDQKGLILKQ